MWTTTWAAGQTLGPLLGGLLMDTLPAVPEIGCSAAMARHPLPEGIEHRPCECAFPWTAVAWGSMGFALCFLLAAFLLRARCGKGQRWVLRRLSTWSQSARSWRSASSFGSSSFSERERSEGGASASEVSVRVLATTTAAAVSGAQEEEEEDEEEDFVPPPMLRLEREQSSSYHGGIRHRRVVLAWSRWSKKEDQKRQQQQRKRRRECRGGGGQQGP